MEANKLPLLAYCSGTKKRFWTHSMFMMLIPDILYQYTRINLQSIFLPHILNREYFNLQQNDCSIISLATCPEASWSISWDMGLCPLRWKIREPNEIIFQVFPTEKIQVLNASRVCNGRLQAYIPSSVLSGQDRASSPEIQEESSKATFWSAYTVTSRK